MKYFVGFLVTIGLIIMLIILLATGGDKKPAPTSVPEAKKLVDYSTTAAIARVTVDGPTDSQQAHNQLRISVSKDKVVYQEMIGYNGQITEVREYPNTPASYAVFLQSLARAGYTQGDTDPAHSDERGQCALGNRYVYEIIENGKSVQRFWTTSCNDAKTYKGNQRITMELFKNQVADYVKRSIGFEFNISL